MNGANVCAVQRYCGIAVVVYPKAALCINDGRWCGEVMGHLLIYHLLTLCIYLCLFERFLHDFLV